MFHFTNDCIANISTDLGIEPLNKDTVDRVMREENITQPLWDEIASKLGFNPLTPITPVCARIFYNV